MTNRDGVLGNRERCRDRTKEGRRDKSDEKVGQKSEDGKKPRKMDTETPQPSRDKHTQEMEKQADLEVEGGGGRADRKQEDRNSEARQRSRPPPGRCPAQT